MCLLSCGAGPILLLAPDHALLLPDPNCLIPPCPALLQPPESWAGAPQTLWLPSHPHWGQEALSCLRGPALAPALCLPTLRGAEQRARLSPPCTNCACGGPSGTIRPGLKSRAAPRGIPSVSRDPSWSCQRERARPGDGVGHAGSPQCSPAGVGTGPDPRPPHRLPTACACAAPSPEVGTPEPSSARTCGARAGLLLSCAGKFGGAFPGTLTGLCSVAEEVPGRCLRASF